MLEGPYKASRIERWYHPLQNVADIALALCGIGFLGFYAYEAYLAGAIAKCAAVSIGMAVLAGALAFGSRTMRVLALGLLIILGQVLVTIT